MKNTSYEKYSLTTNLSKVFGYKITLRLLYKGSVQENRNNLDNFMGNTRIYKGINYEPSYRYTADSLFNISFRGYDHGNPQSQSSISGNTIKQLNDYQFSPEDLLYKQNQIKTQTSNALNFHGKYQITNELLFQTGISLSLVNMQYASERLKKYLSSDEHVVIFNQQYDLRYDKKINNHSLSGFIRYRNFKDNVYWEVDSIKRVDLDGLKPEDDIYMRGSQAIFGERGSTIRNIQSGIVNLNYNYKQKIFISAIANYENLVEGHYVNHSGLFYSLACKYNLVHSSLLFFPDWIDAIYLSTNLGRTGNYPLNSLSNDLFSRRTYGGGDQSAEAIYYTNLANHNLTHEKITEYNYGAETALFNNRVILSGNYYTKNSSDLIMQREIPKYYAGGRFFQNVGKMENKGIELSLEITPITRRDLYWSSKFGISTNKLLITKLSEGEAISFNYDDDFYPDFYARENEGFGSITGYKYEGVWNDQVHLVENNNKYIEHKGLAYLKTGVEDNEKLTENDKTIIGKTMPDFTCNWLNIFQYKTFTCEMLWYGVVGVDKYNATKATTYIAGTHQDVGWFVSESMDFFMDDIVYKSSYFIENASFLRLKTLSFRYQQVKKYWGRVGVEYTLSLENLITLSPYSGYDPEATIYTYNSFSDNAIDKGSYPNPQGAYLSISITF